MAPGFFGCCFCFCLFSVLHFSGAQDKNFNGVTFVGFGTGAYRTPESDASVKAMADLTNADHIAIFIEWFQTDINSTQVEYIEGASNSDEDVIHLAQQARSLGLKIVIKPHVDLRSDPSHWRGQIGIHFTESQWASWFDSYTDYAMHTARLATKLDAELFVVGTELSATQGRTQQWRDLIRLVKSVYKGEIVYGANHEDVGWDGIQWHDELDYIGLDAYYPLANVPSPPLQVLEQAWKQMWIPEFKRLATKWNKRILFTEVGYQSRTDTATTPWSANGPLDLMAQANAYESVFRALGNESFFAGTFWWSWVTNNNDGGPTNLDFTPRGKAAEKVLRQYFAP